MYAGSGSGSGSDFAFASCIPDLDWGREAEVDAMVCPGFKPLGSREEIPIEGS